jgi:hypothetical protein
MKYFVRGITAEVTPIRNTRTRVTEFYSVVIIDDDTIDPATKRPRVLYQGTYGDAMDATEAAVIWVDNYLTKRGPRARAQVA